MTDRPAPRVIPPKKGRRSLPFRVCRGLLILFASLFLLHGGWGYVADRRLEARLCEYRAAGEWADAADFLGPPVPSEQNAALDLRAAAHLVETDDRTFVDADNLFPFLPLAPDEATLIRAAVEKYQAVFARVESAARKPAARWDDDYTVADVEMLSPRGMYAVTRLIHRDALLAHADGDDRRALRRVRNLLDVARTLGAEPLLLAHLRAAHTAAYAGNTAEELAPDLRIGGAPGAVSGADLRPIIDRLLDDDGPRRAMIRGMWQRRWECGMRARSVVAGLPPLAPRATRENVFEGYVLKPVLLADAELTTRMATAELRAFEQSRDWPGFRDALDLSRAFPEVRTHPTIHWWASLYSDSRLVVKLHYRCAADRHLAAAVLALRCYAAAHAGQIPRVLDELVPAYLTAVPADPFAPGGAPLRYRPTRDDPIVYSVGEDGRDDSGSQALRPELRGFSEPPDRWESVDAVAHLRRQPRPHIPPFSWPLYIPAAQGSETSPP